MLTRFEVGNFRSILDPVELSLVAVDTDRDGVVHALDGVGLLCLVGIYGPNASGKSNVLRALQWALTAMRRSDTVYSDGLRLDPFAGHAASPTTIELGLAIGGVRYEYQFEVDTGGIRSEALWHYPLKKRKRVFEREGNRVVTARGIGIPSGIQELVTTEVLFFSLLNRWNIDPIRRVADWLSLCQGGISSARLRWPMPDSYRLFERVDEEEEGQDRGEGGALAPRMGRRRHIERERAMSLLRLADLGISDVHVRREEFSDADGETRETRVMELVHVLGGQRHSLPFREESNGTATWIALLPRLMAALSRGGCVLVDELDAGLHPRLCEQILHLFRSRETNPQGAQIVFTSHDTHLLRSLHRDELWLTEKGADGATALGSVADFNGGRVRKSASLDNAYLAGQFGALPDIHADEFIKALSR